MQGHLHCPHPAWGLEGLVGELPPGFGAELVPRVLQVTSDALHLPCFLMGIPCFYSCLCFAVCYPGCLSRDVPSPCPVSAERHGAQESPGPTLTRTSVEVSSCQICTQKASISFTLEVWLLQKSFTQKPRLRVSPHMSNCYFQPRCPGTSPVPASTVGISRGLEASPSKRLWRPVLLAAPQTLKLALMALVKRRVLFFPQEWAICHEPQIQIVVKARAAHTATFSDMSSFSTHKYLQLDLLGFFCFVLFKRYRFLMVFQISGWPIGSEAPCYAAAQAHLRVSNRCPGATPGYLGQAAPNPCCWAHALC